MNLRLKAAIFSLAAFLSAETLWAGDASKLKVIGFSQDGKYLAFEVYGVQDGSGMPYCEVYLVDVEKNDFVGRPVKLSGHEGDGDDLALNTVREQVRGQVESRIAELEISGEFQGELVVHNPIADLSDDGCHVRFSSHPVTYNEPEAHVYEVFLEQEATGDTCYYFPAQIFTLNLKHQGRIKTLQKDARLPKSRGCVYKYRIERVICFQNKIVVFLNSYRPGFEGPEVRHLVVTGTLDFP